MTEHFERYNFAATEPPIARALLRIAKLPDDMKLLDPCAGHCHLAGAFADAGYNITTNDIKADRPTDLHGDASDPAWWAALPGRHDIVVTNPPFDRSNEIIPLAYAHARVAVLATLRLSWLEPTTGRADFLRQHPPAFIAPLNPRPQYKRNARGKLATDSVTTAWIAWLKPGWSWAGAPFIFLNDWKTA